VLKLGAAPLALLGAAHAKSTVLFACDVDVGTVWQSVHWPWRCQVELAKCCACAPTPADVVAEPPCVSLGGAGLVPEPWHEVQVRVSTSTVPLMCKVGSFHVVDGLFAANEAITLLWHFSQAVALGCPVLAGGGVA